MNQVHLLPEALANLIAAGEVVERPASIVKELIENAIDAKATQIDIELKQAGFRSIKVTDNGTGMNREDAKLALSRHATSKVTQQDDLHHIMTMGFRGEALPSIAAVTKLTLKTCQPDAPSGYEIRLEGGRCRHEQEIGCAPGTAILVEELFFNTPARKKFMKSPATELSHCTQLVELYCMAHHHINFTYRVDNRVVLQCQSTTRLEERLAAIYQKAVPSSWITVEHEGGGIWLKGVMAKPDNTKPTRQGIKLFVNNRPIEHRSLNHAIIQAYKGLIPDGKFPQVFLFITMPPELVDVNVHPAKREVKFQDEHAMYQLTYHAVKTSLDNHDLVPDYQLPSESNRAYNSSPTSGNYSRNISARSGTSSLLKEAAAGYTPAPYTAASQRIDFSPLSSEASEGADLDQQAPTQGKTIPTTRVIGQMGKTYIVGQDEQGFFIVDQHAAHERLLYEKIKQQAAQQILDRQPLLIPLAFDVTPAQVPLLTQLLNDFHQMGLELSPMGGTTFIIQTQPSDIPLTNLVEMVAEVLAFAETTGSIPDNHLLHDQLMISMACHGAIKAGDRMQPEAMQELIESVMQSPHLPTCPHGRPLIFRMSWKELEKYFKRDYR